jgi:hypothetical protein
MRVKQKMSWPEITEECVNLSGQPAGDKAVRDAVERLRKARGKGHVGKSRYKNCGRRWGKDGEKYKLSKEQANKLAVFVRKWRHKRFCTCVYMVREMKLKCSARTVARALKRKGFFWKPVSKKTPLTPGQLAQRRVWVDKYIDHMPTWWTRSMALVIDGVTLTKAPQSLTGRQKHAAQRICHMWMRKGERMDSRAHTFNRYGVQLGIKVPLWGGFTGSGDFPLRLWTPKAKMTKAEWVQKVPSLKRALVQCGAVAANASGKRLKVWQDGEPFLQNGQEYKRAGLEIVKFPANSGDLNPIETVWAQLRKDLAAREQDDLTAGRVLTVAQFRQRVAQLLQSYGTVKPGATTSFLEKLVLGMKRRLQKCKANAYGRCGK